MSPSSSVPVHSGELKRGCVKPQYLMLSQVNGNTLDKKLLSGGMP